MKVMEVVDELRQQYFLCKGPRPVLEVAAEMQISRQTLARFARGGFVTGHVLEAIEQWVETHPHSGRRNP